MLLGASSDFQVLQVEHFQKLLLLDPELEGMDRKEAARSLLGLSQMLGCQPEAWGLADLGSVFRIRAWLVVSVILGKLLKHADRVPAFL